MQKRTIAYACSVTDSFRKPQVFFDANYIGPSNFATSDASYVRYTLYRVTCVSLAPLWCVPAVPSKAVSPCPPYLIIINPLNYLQVFKFHIIKFACMQAASPSAWVKEDAFSEWRNSYAYRHNAHNRCCPNKLHSSLTQITVSESFIISLPTWANYGLGMCFVVRHSLCMYACMTKLEHIPSCSVVI
jgi:hypothetical protein